MFETTMKNCDVRKMINWIVTNVLKENVKNYLIQEKFNPQINS